MFTYILLLKNLTRSTQYDLKKIYWQHVSPSRPTMHVFARFLLALDEFCNWHMLAKHLNGKHR